MSTVERFTKINRDTEVSADARGKTVQVTELVRLSRAGRTSCYEHGQPKRKQKKEEEMSGLSRVFFFVFFFLHCVL